MGIISKILIKFLSLHFPPQLLFSSQHAVEELTCLATWKDNNAHYIVGTLSHSRATSNEERFRCFVYEKINANSEKHGECATTMHVIQVMEISAICISASFAE